MEDLGDILVYLADEAGPQVAYRRRVQLFAKFARLAEYPGLGHHRSDLTSHPVVFFTVDPYVVIFDRDVTPIVIHAVLHGARNVKRVLRSRAF